MEFRIHPWMSQLDIYSMDKLSRLQIEYGKIPDMAVETKD